MASNAPSVAVALVVKSRPSSNLLLLIINKKDVFALFTTSHLPAVGSVVTIEWRKSMSIEASINVLKWRNYKGYEPMGRFTVKEVGSVTKFTGCFYTTGCVCYQGVQLENPAIFNDYIGIVRDDKRVLQRNFIGKLTATVTLSEDADGFYWILDHVDEYFMQIDKCDLKKYRGIVGAVGEGPYQSVHFITCRYFPLDVRLMTRRDEKIDDLKALLGREVIIEVDEDKLNSTRPWHVVGRPMQAKSNLHTIITGKFFLIRTSVEYRGCRDDHENLIVWSEELEVVVDIFKIFKSREYGVYQIEVTRYYEKNSFPRWRVFKLLEFIKPFETGSSTRKDSITKQVPSRIIHQRTDVTRRSNQSLAAYNFRSPNSVIGQSPNVYSSHSSANTREESETKQKPPGNFQRKPDGERRFYQHSSTDSWETSSVVSGQQKRSSNSSDSAAKQISRRIGQQESGLTRGSSPSLAINNFEPSRSVIDQPQSSYSFHSANLHERRLRTYIHRCLEDDNVKKVIKQADPSFFKSLVDAVMSVD